MLSTVIFISISTFRLYIHFRDKSLSVVSLSAIIILSIIWIVSLLPILFINLKQKKIVRLTYRDNIHTSSLARFMLFAVLLVLLVVALF